MTPLDALRRLCALIEAARVDGVEPLHITVPIAVADAIALAASETPPGAAATLLAAMDTFDDRDCNPQIRRRRGVLGAKLRIDPADPDVQAGARDLIAAVALRRRLREALTTALSAGQTTHTRWLRQTLVAADAEMADWRHEAFRALEHPPLANDRGKTMTIEQATHLMITAFIVRSADHLPSTVTLGELHRDWGGPTPIMAGQVLADPIMGQALFAVLAREGIAVTWHRKQGVAALVKKEPGVGQKALDDSAEGKR